jgi:hypothetical protein
MAATRLTDADLRAADEELSDSKCAAKRESLHD